ncbi:unnamed protein product [Caenorhabditis nigoni]
MASLIEMPELVMEKIIGFSHFKAVLTLRQVCRKCRTFIDSLKESKLPDSKFTKLSLLASEMETNGTIRIIYSDQNGSQELSYPILENDRISNQKITMLGYSNNADLAIQDLEWILKFQKSPLRQFYFNFEDFQLQNEPSIHALLIKLRAMFEKSNRRIKTTKLRIITCDESQVTQLLQFADPETLEGIYLSSSDKESEMGCSEMAKTEQWKKALGLNSNFYLMNLNVEDVYHFPWIDIKVNSLDARDFEILKKAYTSFSEFKIWNFKLKIFNEEEQLTNIWGPFHDGGNLDRHWYFRMKDLEEEDYLHIAIRAPIRIDQKDYRVDFDWVEMTFVPDGAIVHDYKEN